MKSVLVLAVLCIIIISTYTISEEQSSRIVKHQLDNQVFVQTSVRWPSNEDSVTVIFSKDLPNSYKSCPGLNNILATFYSKDTPELIMGEYCDTLFVLINYPGIIENKSLREFAIAHESFHIAHQIYGTPYMLGMELEKDNFNYIAEFTELLNENLITKNKVVCGTIENYLNNLPEKKRNLILYKSTYEWPAEYYSKELVFGNDMISYNRVRKEVSNFLEEGDSLWGEFYMLSHKVIDNIEKTLSKKDWQTKVNKGQSIFDLFMKVNGCREYTKEIIKLNISEWKLPY